jgi:hypothetical protein
MHSSSRRTPRIGEQGKGRLVARTEKGVRVELGKRRSARLGLDQIEFGQVRSRRLDVLPAIAFGPAALAHLARPRFQLAHSVVDGAGRHAALAFGGDEVVRHAFGELPDGLDAVLLSESREHVRRGHIAAYPPRRR